MLLLVLLLLFGNTLLQLCPLSNFFTCMPVCNVERLGELGKAVVDVDLLSERKESAF
jgi:hypothetical protein